MGNAVGSAGSNVEPDDPTAFTQNPSSAFSNAPESGREILDRTVAPGASFDSMERFDPPRCHPNTRTAVLQNILQWAMGKDSTSEMRESFVMWLHGPAGAGKSAIAQTISELLEEAGILLASFFFSSIDPARNQTGGLVASIISQIVRRLPSASKLIIGLIEEDPLVFNRSLDHQFVTLLFKPLEDLIRSGTIANDNPMVIVIDGLDECADPERQAEVLKALCTARRRQHEQLSIKFLIASRPETTISFAFNSHFTDLTRLALDNTYRPNQDIFLFLQDKFAEITKSHPAYDSLPPGWPDEDVIDRLVDKASGQFIYASTIIKYVSSTEGKPSERLEIVLGLRAGENELPFAELDALYSHIFASADRLDLVLSILGLVTLGIETSTSVLEALLCLKDGDVPILLGDLLSLVCCAPRFSLMQTADLSVQTFHASLKDFLLDKARAKELHLKADERHAEYAHLGFRYIEKSSFSSFSVARDVLRSTLHHLKYASSSEELCYDIKAFDVGRLQERFDEQGWSDVGDVVDFWCGLIKLLRQLPWDSANILYRYHQEKFDQFVAGNLEEYYEEPFLTFAIVMIYVNPTPITILPTASEEIQNTDGALLRILMYFQRGGKAPFESPYIVALREFLSDPHRCGLNTLTGSRYYSAVNFWMRHDFWKDRGRTLKNRSPKSLYVAQILEKAASTDPSIFIDFVGEFVEGGYLGFVCFPFLDEAVERLVLKLNPEDWKGRESLKEIIYQWQAKDPQERLESWDLQDAPQFPGFSWTPERPLPTS